MGDIKYIAELSLRTEYPPERALSVQNYDKIYNIFVLETGRPTTDTYWTDWGGTYDNPVLPDMELFFGQFLQRVTSDAVLIATENSFLIDDTKVYINLTYKPWQYLDRVTELNSIEGYASSPKNRDNQSDTRYEDEVGNFIQYPTRLLVPSVSNKLSDPISGTALQTTFKYSLINNDGNFDNISERNYYNTPTRIKRTSVDNPKLSDFQTIRYGLVDSFSVSADTFSVTAADINRTLTESVTRKFTSTLFPTLPDNTVDKDIPVGYGTLLDIELFTVGTNQYIAIDPEYLVTVDAIYDSDGNELSHTVSDGIITVTESDGDGGIVQAETADVTGLQNNRIGQIITSELEGKGNIPYRAGPWDKAEADAYVDTSAKLDFYFKGGNLKTLIADVLKSDNAFFITKNDGRLTLRQWGNIYTSHTIPSWQIMEIPKKDTAQGKRYYMSSTTIQYQKRWSDDIYNRSYFDESREGELLERYRRSKPVDFETNLSTATEAEDLATRLLSRFGTISEEVKLKLGYDTSDVNLLDTVELELDINGRIFSAEKEWVVIEVDPAQDTVTLESKGTYNVYVGGYAAWLTVENGYGTPSQPTTTDADGIPSQPNSVYTVEV